MADSSTKKRVKELLRQVQRTQSPEERRSLLRRALDLDPSNEQVNMWMAVYAQDEKERDYYMRRVQEINPRNRMAKLLDKMLVQMPDSPTQFFETTDAPRSPYHFSKLFLIMTALSLLLLGGFLVFRQNRHQADLALLEDGLRAPATITDLWIVEGEDSDTYRAGFAFTAVQQGEEVRFEGLRNTVTAATYRALSVGDTVEVVYPADNPPRAKLALEFNQESLQARFVRDRNLVLIIVAVSVIIDIPVILIDRARQRKTIA
jgi:hypothetical protein